MAFVETISISWFYGADNILNHVKDMGMNLSRPVQMYWKACWIFFMPVILFIVAVLAWKDAEPDGVEDYEFPGAVQFLGWMLELYPLLIIFAVSAFAAIKRINEGKVWAFVKPGPMMMPTNQWGPRPDSGLPLHSWRGETNGAYDGSDK